MATTRIMPLHIGKGRTIGKAVREILDYVKNPEKTDQQRLISSFECDSRMADGTLLMNWHDSVLNNNVLVSKRPLKNLTDTAMRFMHFPIHKAIS